MSKKTKYIGITVLALGAALFFALNLITPLYMDDYSYMFDFVTKERIDSLDDVFRSMGIHYEKVNGRYVTHFLAQLLLWCGKRVFNLLNTAVFAGLVYLMHKLSGCRGWLTPLSLAICAVGLWFCTPSFGQSFLWVTGAANYLWGMALILSLLLFFRYPDLLPRLPKWFSCILVFVLGLFAGNTTENAFAALTVAVIGLAVAHRMNGKKLPLAMYFGAAGALSGGIAMVLSPGELARLSSSGQSFDILVIFERTLDIANRYFVTYWPLLCLMVILLCVGCYNKRLKLSELAMPAVYFVSSLAGAFSLILSPASPDRAWSCVTVFAVLSLQSLMFEVFKVTKKESLARVCAAVLTLAVVLSYCFVYAELISVRVQFEERDMLAHEQITRGEEMLVLPSVSSGCKYSPFEPWGDLDDDTEDWKNIAMARYYGVDRVIKK